MEKHNVYTTEQLCELFEALIDQDYDSFEYDDNTSPTALLYDFIVQLRNKKKLSSKDFNCLCAGFVYLVQSKISYHDMMTSTIEAMHFFDNELKKCRAELLMSPLDRIVRFFTGNKE